MGVKPSFIQKSSNISRYFRGTWHRIPVAVGLWWKPVVIKIQGRTGCTGDDWLCRFPVCAYIKQCCLFCWQLTNALLDGYKCVHHALMPRIAQQRQWTATV